MIRVLPWVVAKSLAKWLMTKEFPKIKYYLCRIESVCGFSLHHLEQEIGFFISPCFIYCHIYITFDRVHDSPKNSYISMSHRPVPNSYNLSVTKIVLYWLITYIWVYRSITDPYINIEIFWNIKGQYFIPALSHSNNNFFEKKKIIKKILFSRKTN